MSAAYIKTEVVAVEALPEPDDILFCDADHTILSTLDNKVTRSDGSIGINKNS